MFGQPCCGAAPGVGAGRPSGGSPPDRKFRAVITQRVAARTALVLILLAALGWRLHNIGFGLPSLYDPDEPMFMLTALRMLAEGTLNPGWFGHPGTTTITMVAGIDAAIAWAGLASGRFADIGAFSRAAYADPALLFIPARIAMALLGTLCVGLTYALGKRLHGQAAGLIAAALLAFNALHIAWSQVIRTDIHASVFMLASLLFSVRVAERGRMRDFLLAGAFAGFATATKWPAATVFIAVIGGFARARMAVGRTERPRGLHLMAAAVAGLVAIFVASPYIFLDWQTVLANVSGEMKAGHLGHTGGSFIANLVYYLGEPIAGSVGIAGLLAMLVGMAIAAVHSPVARWTVIPATLLFLALISSQGLIWSRWILPALPMLCIAAGLALAEFGGRLVRKLNGPVRVLALAALAAAIGVPSVTAAIAQSTERANDTRAQAATWAVAHIPRGSRVAFEHLELSIRDQPWTILFPVGEAGCINGVTALRSGVRLNEVQELRNGSPIVDLGHVSAKRMASCRADFAIMAYYDLYLAEQDDYRNELENYRKLLAGGKTVALFRPDPGLVGGPVVRIVALPSHQP